MKTDRKRRKKKSRSSFRYRQTQLLADLPKDLRGFSNNRYGGHQNKRLRTYGGKFGAGSECYVYSEEEKRELENRMRAEGRF
jgi:hypothetical protein